MTRSALSDIRTPKTRARRAVTLLVLALNARRAVPAGLTANS